MNTVTAKFGVEQPPDAAWMLAEAMRQKAAAKVLGVRDRDRLGMLVEAEEYVEAIANFSIHKLAPVNENLLGIAYTLLYELKRRDGRL